MVGGHDADRDDIVRTDNDGVGRHRDHRIEIARRQRVAQVPQVIGQECLHQRKVGAQGGFEQIALAVEVDPPLAGLDRRADAGLRQDPTEPMPTGADAFDQRSLRDKLHLEFPGHHLPLGFRVQADMAHDSLAHQLRLDELADSAAW
jgi:hypothetical protein